MLVKFVLGGTIFAACSLIGYVKAYQLEDRVKEIDNIIDSINVLETEVVYYQNALPTALKRCSKRSKGMVSELYEEVAITIGLKEGECLEDIWQKNVYEHLDVRDVLDKADVEIVADFGRELGLGNTTEQSKYFEYIRMQLKQQRTIAHGEMIKSSKLYKKLGVLLGVGLFIIII